MNIGAVRHKEERDEQISSRIRFEDMARRAPMPPEGECGFCGERLTQDGDVWVDLTGGDVCGVRSADSISDNLPHEAS